MKQRNYTLSSPKALQEMQALSAVELYEQYGINIDENDGSVWDTVESKSFKSLKDWAEYTEDQENDDLYAGISKIGGKMYFDDDGF